MKAGKHSKAVKRLGSRYGKRTRERLSKVEVTSKTTHKCPYCNYISAKKVANGIFSCNKCSSKFTGKAYAPMKKKTSKSQTQKTVQIEDELFTEKNKKNKEDDEMADEAKKTVKSLEKDETETDLESPQEE